MAVSFQCMTKSTTNKKERKKEEQSYRYHSPWFQTILQSYSNENSIAVAQKETDTSMEQNRKFRNKPTVMRPLIMTKKARLYNGEKNSFIYKQCWESWKATCKRIKSDYSLEPYTRIN